MGLWGGTMLPSTVINSEEHRELVLSTFAELIEVLLQKTNSNEVYAGYKHNLGLFATSLVWYDVTTLNRLPEKPIRKGEVSILRPIDVVDIRQRLQDFQVKGNEFKPIKILKKQLDELLFLSDEEVSLKKEIEDLRAGTVADTNGWLVPVVGI